MNEKKSIGEFPHTMIIKFLRMQKEWDLDVWIPNFHPVISWEKIGEEDLGKLGGGGYREWEELG